MLSAPEAVAVLALAVTCAEPYAVSTAAKSLGKHVDTVPDAATSSSTQQIVTAQQHLMMALPTVMTAVPAEWAAQRDSIVRMCRSSDEVRVAHSYHQCTVHIKGHLHNMSRTTAWRILLMFCAL